MCRSGEDLVARVRQVGATRGLSCSDRSIRIILIFETPRAFLSGKYGARSGCRNAAGSARARPDPAGQRPARTQ